MTKNETLKLALEVLKRIDEVTPTAMAKLVIPEIEQVLAQPEQEPVAWKLVPIKPTDEMLKAMDECSTEGYDERLYAGHAASVYMAAVDAAPTPPQRKPLSDEEIKTRTDEQIEATFKMCGGRWNGDHWVIEDADLHPFVRAIEGPELNTLRAISDEYNAWIKHHAKGHTYDDFLAKRLAAHGIKGEA